jgi:IclR family transcriptional regulator, positive regulator for flagellar biogenesis
LRQRKARSTIRAVPRPRKPDADNVSALQRGFDVLDCVAAARRPIGNGDIAAATGIPRPTVSRLVATLIALGHLRNAAEADKVELAAGVVRLAQSFLEGIDLRARARPHLAALAEATGGSAFLGLRDGDDMLVVESGRARSAVIVMGADVGTRMSLATSALGRAWLAGIDEATREAVIAHWRARSARKQPAIGPGLLKAIAQAREHGHAVSLGEWHPDIHAAAVPVRTAGGEVVAINCGGPSLVLPAERLHKVVVPHLLAAAQAFAKDIGGVAGLALTLPTPPKKQRLSPTGA